MNIDNLSIEDVWEQLERITNENSELIKDMNTTYQIKLTDITDGLFSLTFSHGKASVSREVPLSSDCSLQLNSKNFKSLLKGELNATTAFMTGRLSVKGNIGLALKLESILKELSL